MRNTFEGKIRITWVLYRGLAIRVSQNWGKGGGGGGTILGAPIVRIVRWGGLYWRPLMKGNKATIGDCGFMDITSRM